jgi:hypothetical protein
MKKVLMVATLAACGSSNNATVDAPVTHDGTVALDAPKTTGNAKSHTLYLNTEGVSVTAGADDATMNKSSIIGAPATLMPFLVGAAGRDTRLAEIATQIETTLAPYGVTVVTTRPATGPYDMVVVTDDTGAKLTPSLASAGSITPTTCNSAASVVSFIFPVAFTGTSPAQVRNLVANQAIAIFANNAGVPISTTTGDCMCYVASSCVAPSENAICTIGGATTAVDQSNSGIEACGDTSPTMDEAAKFLAAFGNH